MAATGPAISREKRNRGRVMLGARRRHRAKRPDVSQITIQRQRLFALSDALCRAVRRNLHGAQHQVGKGMVRRVGKQLAGDGYRVAVLSSSGKGKALAKELGWRHHRRRWRRQPPADRSGVPGRALSGQARRGNRRQTGRLIPVAAGKDGAMINDQVRRGGPSGDPPGSIVALH